MAQIVSVNVYQIDGGKLASPQVFGFPVLSITRNGVFPTRAQAGSTQFDQTVEPSIQSKVYSGIQVRNGRHGFKTYYTDAKVAAIITAANT
jgi:hypothetical protein